MTNISTVNKTRWTRKAPQRFRTLGKSWFKTRTCLHMFNIRSLRISSCYRCAAPADGFRDGRELMTGVPQNCRRSGRRGKRWTATWQRRPAAERSARKYCRRSRSRPSRRCSEFTACSARRNVSKTPRKRQPTCWTCRTAF